MTDKELIRALRACPKCQLYEYGDCGVDMKEHAADRLEALLAENKHLREVTEMMPKWVSVSERLPDENSTVLVYRPNMERKILLVHYGTFWEDGDVKYTEFGYENGAITHWMPLPSTEGGGVNERNRETEP